MLKLKGKVAVLTGGEGPLGRAVTKKFLEEGAKVVIGWYSHEEWEDASSLVGKKYREQIIGIQVDATKEGQVKNLMERAEDAFGSINILLHMVGGGLIPEELVWNTDNNDWDRLYEVRLKSAFLCSKHAIKVMLKNKHGRIVFFHSGRHLRPRPKASISAVASAGLDALKNILAEELAGTGITVNCAVMLAPIDTWKTRAVGSFNLRKMIKTSAIADVLCDLCSNVGDVLSGGTISFVYSP